ncbi:MAG TPA: hypothetical protein PLL06_12595, partial [Acidobacteriota bacterium]|nr:hypothetical protein [Acidobacteriota bacterium]
QTATYTTTLTRTNFSGAVDLQVYYTGTNPVGLTYSFNSDPTTLSSVTLSLFTVSSLSPGSYTFYVAGQAAGATVNNSNIFTLTVSNSNGAPSVDLSVSPGSQVAFTGRAVSYTVTLSRTNYSGPVDLVMYYTGLNPQGVTYSLSSNPTTSNLVTLVLYTSVSTPPATYSFFVRGTSPDVTINDSNIFALTVTQGVVEEKENRDSTISDIPQPGISGFLVPINATGQICLPSHQLQPRKLHE